MRVLGAFGLLLLAVTGRVATGEDFQAYRNNLVASLAKAGDASSLEAEMLAALKKIRQDYSTPAALNVDSIPKVVAVVGGGLSGLTAAMHLLEQNTSVLLVDANDYFGGNSAKASSGINGGLTEKQKNLTIEDSVDLFYRDTMQSSGYDEGSFTSTLVRKMAEGSSFAVDWIASRSSTDLPDVGQLGGHSTARTHRPRGRLTGAAFISGLERAVSGKKGLTMLKGTKLESMRQIKNGANSGWELGLRRAADGRQLDARVAAVVLATGGYAFDKVTMPHPSGLKSLIDRPRLSHHDIAPEMQHPHHCIPHTSIARIIPGS